MTLLFWLNITVPIVADTLFYFYLMNPDKTKVVAWSDVFMEMMAVIQIITGVILVKSVLRIRAFFKSRNDEDCIETRSLMQHAVSFILYLLTIIFYFSAWTLFTIWNQSVQIRNFMVVSILIWKLGQLISSLLLCVILWRLGAKEEEVPTTNEIVLAKSIEVVEITESQASIDCKIWNDFVKRRKSSKDTNHSYRLRSSSRKYVDLPSS